MTEQNTYSSALLSWGGKIRTNIATTKQHRIRWDHKGNETLHTCSNHKFTSHSLVHPDNNSLWKIRFVGSKYPANSLCTFENKIAEGFPQSEQKVKTHHTVGMIIFLHPYVTKQFTFGTKSALFQIIFQIISRTCRSRLKTTIHCSPGN